MRTAESCHRNGFRPGPPRAGAGEPLAGVERRPWGEVPGPITGPEPGDHSHPNPTAHLAGVWRGFTVAKHVGRHRAPGYSPAKEIGQIASDIGCACGQGLRDRRPVRWAGRWDGHPGPGRAGPVRLRRRARSSPPRPRHRPTVSARPASRPRSSPSRLPPRPRHCGPARPGQPPRRRARRDPPAGRRHRSTPAAARGRCRAEHPQRRLDHRHRGQPVRHPLRAGGSSPSTGFDCSGFTSYVYRLAGKGIPRTAEGQRAASTPVSNPQPGDLMFFGFPAYHAAIYAGGGMIYDAQHPGTTTGLAQHLDLQQRLVRPLLTSTGPVAVPVRAAPHFPPGCGAALCPDGFAAGPGMP